MTSLTSAQRATLEKMRGAHVVAQLDAGEVLVVFGQQYQDARVIDFDGRIFALSRYLFLIDQRSAPDPVPQSAAVTNSPPSLLT